MPELGNPVYNIPNPARADRKKNLGMYMMISGLWKKNKRERKMRKY